MNFVFSPRWVPWSVLVTAGGLFHPGFSTVCAVEDDGIDFQRDIRPLISDRCFACHGPDEQKAGLRLDSGDGLASGSRHGEILDRAAPAESEILRRIFSEDPDEVMPPPEIKKPLNEEQKSLLRQWVMEGARYERHWAFISPQDPSIPDVSNPGWCRNEIDFFVLSGLEKRGMTPSPEADRWTLGRRLALDLTGLLPEPSLLADFVADDSDQSWHRYVDSLLGSAAYGERWGRDWLDLARYADTNGYEKDRPRTIWPYRDWVIRALNHNMPFDEFSIRQLAGDMLPDRRPEDVIATGFHRNTMTNEEGGIDVAEFRYHAVVDRVKTTGAAWMGLTLSCAQCHNHKYDPVTQDEYFQVMALFDNADEVEMPIPDKDEEQRMESLRRRIDTMSASRAEAFGDGLDQAVMKWAESLVPTAVNWKIQSPEKLMSERHATLTVLEDQSVLASGDKPNKDFYTVSFNPGAGSWTALRLEVLPHESLPFDGPGRAHFFNDGDFFLSEIGVRVGGSSSDESEWAKVRIAGASASHEKNGRPVGNALDGQRDTGWQVGNRFASPARAVFNFAEPVTTEAGDSFEVVLDQHFIHQVTIGRFRLALADETAAELKAAPVTHEVESVLNRMRRGEEPDQHEIEILTTAFLDQAPEVAGINQSIRSLREQMWDRTTSLVMQERSEDNRRQTRLRHRGEFLQPRHTVEPGVPDFLLWRPGQQEPANRLEFARWLFEPGHPLTSRVFVNRTWSRLFGKGIVSTVEDFGLQGSMPTHPQLLDWLALEFESSGWDIKALHRLIVSSATYRQSSSIRTEYQNQDPTNTWYHRGSRFRIPAEMVRDTALQAAGLLEMEMGGPGVFPPQDSSVTRLAYGSPGYNASGGADRYRRGIYTYWKRTAPYASFMTFDAPSGDMVCTRRERSNTPLQSLVLLNDPVYVEAARSMAAELAVREFETDRGLVESLFLRALNRPATGKEITTVIQFMEDIEKRVASGDLEPVPLPSKDMEEAVSAARWTAVLSVTRAVLNLDEMITRQ